MFGPVTLREFESQPDAWRVVLERARSGALDTPTLTGFDEIIVFGSGSSYYLAIVLAELLEHDLGQRAVARPSAELWFHRDRYLTPGRQTLGLAVSRSGESSEAVLAAQALIDAGVPVLALGCQLESTLMRLTNRHLLVPEGREEGLVMSRSFTSMLLAFQAALVAGGGPARDLERVPPAGQRLLEEHGSDLATLARFRDFGRFVFLASGVSYGLAVEASLKMQEMAIVTSEAYHSLEYRHGPKSTVGPDTLVTLFALDGYRAEQRALLDELRGYGAATLVIGEGLADLEGSADLAVDLESGLDETGRLVLNLLPVHRLGFETAARLGRDPDESRNLTQVVRLEPA